MDVAHQKDKIKIRGNYTYKLEQNTYQFFLSEN